MKMTKEELNKVATVYRTMMNGIMTDISDEEIEAEDISEVCSDLYEDFLELCENSSDEDEVLDKALETIALIAFPVMLNAERNGWDFIDACTKKFELLTDKKEDKVKEQGA